MRPLDDMFSSSSSVRPKSGPSSIASRSPSPGGLTAGAGMTTFFLTEENNFGVHSISDSISSQNTPNIQTNAAASLFDKSGRDSEETDDVENIREQEPGDVATASHRQTPSVGSILSTPSSPQHHLSSSAVSDDSELDISSHEEVDASNTLTASSSFPQLIMPRVNMPRRKAFTETGKTMGKLKVMVVGDSGIGKSSLIQAILHTSPDIVHYDPPHTVSGSSTSSPSSSFVKPSLSRRSTIQTNAIPPTEQIVEIKASTRAYPAWWKSETERESKRPSLPRRESVGEVLERNLCFVDTPGYGNSDDFNELLARVSSYIEENYEKVNNLISPGAGNTTELLNLLSNGTTSVDLIIYVVLHRLKPVDITIMRHLSTLTPILPVIAKSDSLSHTQTLTLKLSLLRDLRLNSIPIFTFGKSYSELERSIVNGIPWAISCLRDETSEMDASLLMRDDPPTFETYIPSDLRHLVTSLSENTSWLRFSSAKKFLEWRQEKNSTPSPDPSSLSMIPFPSGGFAMARVGDHMDREERLARVRLAQWATDMRKSVRQRMNDERDEFERIENAERVKWLVARLNEAISQETRLIPVSTSVTHSRSTVRSSRTRRKVNAFERDPLGLVWIQERWGTKVSKSLVWLVEAGVVLGSGWVVWKYFLESGLSSLFQNSRTS